MAKYNFKSGFVKSIGCVSADPNACLRHRVEPKARECSVCDEKTRRAMLSSVKRVRVQSEPEKLNFIEILGLTIETGADENRCAQLNLGKTA